MNSFEKATLDDCDEVYHLICDLEETILPYERFTDIFCKQLRDEHYYCIVSKTNNQVIGVLNLRFEEQLHHEEKIAEIMEFAISKEYRSQGIGKAMFDFGCEIAKKYGGSQIEVACNQKRKDTHRFYERQNMSNTHYKFSKMI